MDKFSFYAPAYLYKSGQPKQGAKVGGVITTEDKDTDGEILKSIDWTYFTNGLGKIKYEHHEIKGPDAIIGFPQKLVKKGKDTHFEGTLVPYDPDAPEDKLTTRERLAKSVVTLLEHIEKFNATNPAIPQRAGWSVEGDYVSKDRNGVVKARVTNVVFTTKPVNPRTFATLIKSLTVGAGLSPETQTGWGALSKENLEHITKTKEGDNEMFMTKDEVYKSCLKKGMDEEAAKKEAEEWEAKQRKEKEGEFEAAEKSLSNSRTLLRKSISDYSKFEAIDLDIDIRGQEKALAKSLQTDRSGNIDITDYLGEMQNVQMTLLKSISALNEKIDIVAGMQKSLAEAQLGNLDSAEFSSKAVAIAEDKINGLEKSIKIVVTALRKSVSNLLGADRINNLKYDDTAGDDNSKTKDLTKSQKKQVLKSLIESGEVEDTAMIMFESGNGYMQPKTENLVKSNAAKILNL